MPIRGPQMQHEKIQITMYLYGVALLGSVRLRRWDGGAWDVHIGKDFCIWQYQALRNYSLILPDERGYYEHDLYDD